MCDDCSNEPREEPVDILFCYECGTDLEEGEDHAECPKCGIELCGNCAATCYDCETGRSG